MTVKWPVCRMQRAGSRLSRGDADVFQIWRLLSYPGQDQTSRAALNQKKLLLCSRGGERSYSNRPSLKSRLSPRSKFKTKRAKRLSFRFGEISEYVEVKG